MNILKNVRSLVSFRRDEIVEENILFRLQSVWTCRIVFVAALLSTESEVIGERLSCLASDQLAKLANVYCLMSNVFTVNDGHRVYLTYYQWIPFFLGLQAASFSVARFVWHNVRGESVQILMSHFENSKIDLRFIKTRSTFWVVRLYACEAVNLLNLCLQIYLADVFLKGRFGLFGYKWFTEGKEFLDSVFPKRAKCTFYTFGASGSRQVHDSLCILLHNIHNEYIFITVWFLYTVLLSLSLLNVTWRILTIFITRRMYFRVSLFFKLSMTPFKQFILDKVTSMDGLTHCDCILISFALSNLSNDDLLNAVVSLSNKLDRINQPYLLDLDILQNESQNQNDPPAEPSTSFCKQNRYSRRSLRSV